MFTRARTKAGKSVRRLGTAVTVVTASAAVVTTIFLGWANWSSRDVFIVTSGSMTPTFDTGAAVVSERLDPAAVRAGDVITFRANLRGNPTTHRVVSVVNGPTGRQFQTKGDANRTPDPLNTPDSRLLGRTLWSAPLLGYWLAFFQSPRGRAIVLGTPLVLIMIAQLRSMIPARRRGKHTVDVDAVRPVPEPVTV